MKEKQHSNKVRQTRADTIFDIINYSLVALVVLICLYPLYYTVVASLSDPLEVTRGNVTLWIKGLTLDSYKTVFEYKPLWRGYRNTILYTTVGTVYNLFLLLPASYALSRKELKCRGLVMGIFVFTMYFGGGMIPTYLNIKDLGLLDNWLVMVLPGAFSVYNMIITRTFFTSNFPNELAEAARIDGAGEARIFFQLALPLSSAIIGVMALYHAVGHWNSYFNALLYLSDTSKYPLQMVLREVLMQDNGIAVNMDSMSTEELMDAARRQRLAETMKYSVIFIANAPVLAMYPFVQKYFTKGVMVGALKG